MIERKGKIPEVDYHLTVNDYVYVCTIVNHFEIKELRRRYFELTKLWVARLSMMYLYLCHRGPKN